jgi:NAD(P)-dependent dehydrogenase (short-subunit alcohol dehydrogenase family)
MATASVRSDPTKHKAAVDLSGSVALVTGGGRGVGRVLARELAAAGAAVGVIARSAAELDETVELVTAAGGVAAAATADVTDRQRLTAAFAGLRRQLGAVDLLINNAGVCGPIGPAWEVDPDDWWRTCEVNLRSVQLCTRLALPEMIARGRGRIVNVTSYAGVHRWPEVSAYAVSKAAVVKLTENLAAETREHGICVFSVHPGLVPIGLTEAALDGTERSASEARVYGWLRGEIAAGRGREPESAARLILLLAGGRADGLSGRHLSVHDDLEALLARTDQIRRDDLYTLRLAELPQTEEFHLDHPARATFTARPTATMAHRIESEGDSLEIAANDATRVPRVHPRSTSPRIPCPSPHGVRE